LLWGTIRRKRTSPDAARARTASSSFFPPSVRLATTRTSLTGFPLRSFAWRPDDARTGSGRGGRRREDAVDRAGHAILVRTADDRREAVEVEDRGRRGHLPLERQPPPRVGDAAWSPTPARDHVVDEHQRGEAQAEAGD